MKTSEETKKTLESIARLSYGNFDQLSEEDKYFAMLLAADTVKTFVKSWIPSREIENHFEWCSAPILVVKEAFGKLVSDIDREFNSESAKNV